MRDSERATEVAKSKLHLSFGSRARRGQDARTAAACICGLRHGILSRPAVHACRWLAAATSSCYQLDRARNPGRGNPRRKDPVRPIRWIFISTHLLFSLISIYEYIPFFLRVRYACDGCHDIYTWNTRHSWTCTWKTRARCKQRWHSIQRPR